MPVPEDLTVSGVRLPSSVIEGIAAEVKSGNASGALFGATTTGGDFRIDGFEPAHLSERPCLRTIGIYRTHRRPGLQPSDGDAEMMLSMFPEGPSILLLVKPLSADESVGAFFRCLDGRILDPGTSSQEFPFRTTAGETEPLGPPAEERGPRRVSWLIPSAIAAGLGAALLLHYAAPRSEDNPVAALTDSSLHLHAEPEGATVRLSWNRNFPRLASRRATLSVADGSTTTGYRLTPVDLRNGYLDWPAHSRNLTFRIEIERPGQWPLVESVDVANPSYPINSSSDTPESKPSPAPPASAASGDTGPQAAPVTAVAGTATGNETQKPGRLKKFFSGITNKAAHLWPFHSAKPEQQTQ